MSKMIFNIENVGINIPFPLACQKNHNVKMYNMYKYVKQNTDIKKPCTMKITS